MKTPTLLRQAATSLMLTLALQSGAQAATTDLSTKPLIPIASVLPNLMFILDNSVSMAWSYMPDTVLSFAGKYGYASSQCNGVYYNPNLIYTAPIKADGSSYANSSFTSAKKDGFNAGSSSVNLSSSFVDYQYDGTTNNSGFGSQAAFYYTYTGTQTSTDPKEKSRLQDYYNTGSTFYTECNTTPSAGSSITTITITAASSASVNRIKVNGSTDIMDSSSSSSSTTSTVASNIASKINNCTSSAQGSCDVSGYSASASGNVLTIYGPASVGDTITVIMNSSSMTANGISMSSSNTYNNVATFAANPAVVFTKVTVSATSGPGSTDERTNFANWFSYYRTRINMMKSATSIAFAPISSSIRAAFMTLNSTGSSYNLDFATFDSTQKTNWYAKLFAATPTGSTPLRSALANAGRIYAKKLTTWQGITGADPIQYSCQKNFTMLSTDGFWNGAAGYKEDGSTAVGNTDGIEPRPMNDGSGTTYTKTTTQIVKTQSQVTQSTSQIQKTTTAYQTHTANLQRQTSQLRQCTSYLQKKTGTLQKRTYSGWSWGSWSNAAANTATVTINSASSAVIKDDFSAGGSIIVANKTGNSSSTSNINTLATYLAAQINACTSSRTGSCDVSGYSAVASGNVVTITGPASVGTTLSWSMDNGSASITKTAFVAGPNTCTWSSTQQCQYSWGSWANATSCDTSYSTDTTNGTTWSGNGTNCQYTSCTGSSGVSSCTPGTPSTGPNYTVSSVTVCPTVVTSAYANTTSDCTETTVPDGSGYTTQCQYGAWSSWANYTASTSTTTLTLSGSSSTYLYGISVSSNQIMSGSTSSTTDPATLAGYIVTKINNCTSSRTGNCDVSGYSATASGAVVTIRAPSSTTSTPSISKNGSMTATTAAFVPDATCTPAAQSAGPTYTVHPARECSLNTTTVGVSSCTPSTGVTCATVTTGPSAVSSCTASGASSGNNYTATTCGTSVTTQGVPATCSTTTVNGLTTSCASTTTTATVSKCTPAAPSSPDYKTITCSAASTTGGTSDTLADVAEYYYANDLRTSALGNCTSGSTSNTLCVAGESMTDKTSYNNVQSSSEYDTANWQHMTTFTLGLGARGSMAYGDTNYMSDSSGDFYSVHMGSTADSTASPPICSWLSNGSTCNWPVPVSNTQTAIDDLWHAAVNGRGTYYSASDPVKLADALSDLLNKITATGRSIAAPTLSNTSITAGDNFMFQPSFGTDNWYGQLVRRQINPTTHKIVVDASGTQIDDWEAQEPLNFLSWSARSIYIYDSTNANGNKLKAFTYANLGANQTYFDSAYLSTPTGSGLTGLSQYLGTTTGVTALSAADKTTAAGTNLVNFLRGERTNEGAGNNNAKYYRLRSHVLGDIANSEAAYAKAPSMYYADAGYGSFKAAQANRQPMVYVGANDGMLHAFYAYGGDGSDDADPVQYMDTATGLVVGAAGAGIIQVTGGSEAWAYIPSMLLPRLFTLADKNYNNKHQFFVDGTPVIGDVCTLNCTDPATAVWKTILVGGLNNGGKGYYALDITNPAAPKALWEFTDANLGYSYGKPAIVKLNDADTNVGNTWAVLVTSGYNNTADGLGRLYVLKASDGTLIRSISTGVGSTTTPSGLGQIAAAAAASGNKNNTVTQVYGGDLLGNVWRFDVNGRVGAAGYDAQLLATLKTAGSVVQPVTTRPEVGLVDTNVVVYVGTGKYLGNNNGVTPFGDAGNTDQQTMYAIKDPLATGTTPATAVYSNLRTSGVAQTMTVTTCTAAWVTAELCSTGDEVRTGSKNPVDFSTQSGWYLDLPSGTGERINTDPLLVSGTLSFNSNVPQSTACSEGSGYPYNVDAKTGAPLQLTEDPTNSFIGKKISNAMISRPVAFQLEDGKKYEVYSRSDENPEDPRKLLEAPPTSRPAKRTSWRELINE